MRRTGLKTAMCPGIKKPPCLRWPFSAFSSTSYFLDLDLEEEDFLLEEAVFLEEEEELQQDLVALEP